MKMAINRLTNANIYVDGNNWIGMAEEIKLPDVNFIMAEHKALGMIGKVEFFAGIEKLETTMKWASFCSEIFTKFANPFAPVQIQARANLQTIGSADQAVVTFMTMQSKGFPLGNYKPQDNAEYETKGSVTYIKQVIGDQDLIEIDVLANIFKIDGKDVLAQYRNNIGA